MVFMIDKSLGFILTSKTKEIDVDSTLGEFGVTNDDPPPPPPKRNQKRRRRRRPSSVVPSGHALTQ